MASEPDVSEMSSLFERLVRNRDMSLFLPFIFGFSDSSSSSPSGTEQNSENQDSETGGGTTDGPNRERIILVNPFTQGMVVIDGASSLEALLREIGLNNNKGGQPPASKESIEAMPCFEIEEGESEGEGEEGIGECVVCLEEFGVGVVVKEMPCRHRFHPNCIEKWLGIHGSCPVCRYEMPVEERDEVKKRDNEERGGERRRNGGEIWVSFSINRGNRRNNQDQDQDQQNQAPGGGDVDGDGDDSSDSTASTSRSGDGDAEPEPEE